MGNNIGKNISKNLSSKYSQKRYDRAKQPAANAFETASKKAIQNTAQATSDLIGYKFPNKILKISKHLQKNNSEKVTNEHDKERPKGRYMYLQKKDKKSLMN